MSRFRTDPTCDRARISAALAPDGELSELEWRSLQSHLRACAPCAAYAERVEGLALMLRNAEYVYPAPITVRVVRRRQVLVARARPVAAAAAVAVMAIAVAARAPLPVDERDPGLRTATAPVVPEQREMQELRVLRFGATLAVERSRLDPMLTTEPI